MANSDNDSDILFNKFPMSFLPAVHFSSQVSPLMQSKLLDDLRYQVDSHKLLMLWEKSGEIDSHSTISSVHNEDKFDLSFEAGLEKKSTNKSFKPSTRLNLPGASKILSQ